MMHDFGGFSKRTPFGIATRSISFFLLLSVASLFTLQQTKCNRLLSSNRESQATIYKKGDAMIQNDDTSVWF